MTVICFYCLLQFQALLCCPQSIPHDSDMFIVCCSFRPSFAVFSWYHMTVICLLFAAVSGPPLLSSVNTTWQWYVYCLLQFQALLCYLQSIPLDSDMCIVCCSFRPSFAVFSHYHMTVICVLFAAVSGPVLTRYHMTVICLLFAAVSGSPLLSSNSAYHMTVICLLFAAVSGPPLLSSNNTTWQWYVYCLLQFQALLKLSSVNTTWQWCVYCLLQFQGLLCCPQSIPHDSDTVYVCAVSGPPLLSVNTTWQWYVYVFAAVSGPPLKLSAVNTTWSLSCGIVWSSFKGGPETAANNTTYHWSCLLFAAVSKALLKLQQTIPHDSDMWYCLLQFQRRAWNCSKQYHISLSCLLTAAAKEGLKLQQTINMTVICGIVCCSFRQTINISLLWYQWGQQRRAWNCSKQ